MALFESYDRRINQINAELAKHGVSSIEEAKEMVSNSDYLVSKDLFLRFLDIKNPKQSILFYVENVEKIDDIKMNYFLKWIISLYQDSFKMEDKDDLILNSLYDKIVLYSK